MQTVKDRELTPYHQPPVGRAYSSRLAPKAAWRSKKEDALCRAFSPLKDRERAMHMTECRAPGRARMTPLRAVFGGTFVRREAATGSDMRPLSKRLPCIHSSQKPARSQPWQVGMGVGIQKGALLHQQAAQAKPCGSAKPEDEFRKSERQGSEGDKAPLPLCYRQDTGDRWEGPLTK